jgi:hypothetical protein
MKISLVSSSDQDCQLRVYREYSAKLFYIKYSDARAELFIANGCFYYLATISLDYLVRFSFMIATPGVELVQKMLKVTNADID